jgi:hypothetical protein
MDPIIAYRAYWHTESNTGKVFLKLESGSTTELPLDSASEFAALCDMLERTPGACYNANERLLDTTWRKVGGK